MSTDVKPDWYLFEFGDRAPIISKKDHLVNDEGDPWHGYKQQVTPLYKHPPATELERLQHNEVIYKAQIKNLHRLLGELTQRELGSPAHKASWDEARAVVLAAHMTEYKPGEVANND